MILLCIIIYRFVFIWKIHTYVLLLSYNSYVLIYHTNLFGYVLYLLLFCGCVSTLYFYDFLRLEIWLGILYKCALLFVMFSCLLCSRCFQIKCNQKLNLTDEIIEESDEEINRLKQRIRSRRRQKQIEQVKTWPSSATFDCLTECERIYFYLLIYICHRRVYNHRRIKNCLKLIYNFYYND